MNDKPKCRDCKWWCGKLTSIGRECMNPQLQWKWKGKAWQMSARYKPRCQVACKGHFEAKAVTEE